MKKFFDPLPRYDVAQLQTYLYILDSNKGELVEQLKMNKSEMKITEVNYDSEFIENKFKPDIINFCKMIYKFYHDQEIRKAFANANVNQQMQIIEEMLI